MLTLMKAVMKALFGVDGKKKDVKHVQKLNPTAVIPRYKRIVVDGREYLVKDVLSINDNEIVVVGLDNVTRVIKRKRKNPPF